MTQPMTAKESMRHKLRILAGLRPQSPTDEELELIITDIVELAAIRRPKETDWIDAAARFVPNAGQHKHAGASNDLSDLNALLVQILNQIDSPRVLK